MNDTTAGDRRTFLKMVAGGALGASASGIVANSVAQEGYTGKLVFTYDDGVIEDYEQAYQQAHGPEGVPACVGMISSRVNTNNSLSESHLHELQNAGWEIMSHSRTHRALTDVSVTSDIEPGDDVIHVSWDKHGEHPGDTIRISDSNKSEVVTVAGQGSNGTITLEDSVSQQFSAADTIERYTDDIIESELRDSRQQLENYGLDVTDMIMPYGAYGDRTQEIISNHYTAVANAAAGDPSVVNGEKGLNPYDNLNLPHLSRRYFREGRMTYDEIGRFLDKVAEEDVLGIFGGHTWWDRTGDDPLPPERIRNTIQMAKDRNIEIVTLRQALDDLGGSPTTTTTQEPTTTATTTTATTTATTTETTATTTETVEPTTTETTTSTSTTTTETTDPTTTTSTTTESTTDTTTETTDTTQTTETTETTNTTETTTDATTQTTTTTTDPTETTTEEDRNTPPDPPNGGGGGGGGGGGSSGGNGGGAAPTTTTTTQTPTTTTTSTTTEPTTMPLTDETSTMTKTPTTTETPTSTETPSLTGTTQDGGNLDVEVPGFGWLTTFGMAGSLAAYALSRLDGDDEE